MKLLSTAELAASVRFSRAVRNQPNTLFAVMRNEAYLLASFLEHYRRLGVAQFVVFDDGSDDGTTEELLRQPDCCVGTSILRYGDRVKITDPDFAGLSGRVGPLLKRILPGHYLRGQYVLVADADEFLLLPERYPTVASVVGVLDAHGWKSVSASLIDFYPAELADLRDETPPKSVAELFSRFGLFDAEPFMAIEPGSQPRKTRPTASQRLFLGCGIRQAPKSLDWLPAPLVRMLPFPAPNAAWFKTPIVKFDGETWMDGAHEANVPPPPGFILAMAHFKFTGDTYKKISSAIRLKSHARKSQKYEHYEQMLMTMERRKLSFRGPSSTAYVSPEQLASLGLMVLP